MNCLCGKKVINTFKESDEKLYLKAYYQGYIDSDGTQVRNGKPIDNLIEHRLVQNLATKYLKVDKLCTKCKVSANRIIMMHKNDDWETWAAMFMSKRIMHETRRAS